MSIFDRVSRLLSETSGCAASFGLTQRDVSFLHDLSARAPAILSEKQEKWLSDLEARVFGKPEVEAKPDPTPRDHGIPRAIWEQRFAAEIRSRLAPLVGTDGWTNERINGAVEGELGGWPENEPDWREWEPEEAVYEQ